jgi:hypothetical protein
MARWGPPASLLEMPSTWHGSGFAAVYGVKLAALLFTRSYCLPAQVKQYGIPQPRAFLEQHFPDGAALESAFVSPAVVDQVSMGACRQGVSNRLRFLGPEIVHLDETKVAGLQSHVKCVCALRCHADGGGG